MNILAKKSINGVTQTLKEHTDDVMREAMVIADSSLNDLVCTLCNFEKDKLKDLIFFAAYFHDIGKATKEFQDTINKHTKSFHSLYSAGIAAGINDFEIAPENDAYLNLLFLIVLTHHKLYWQGIFTGVNHDKCYVHNFLPEAETFFYNYKNCYQEMLNKPCKYNFEYKKITMEELDTFIDSYLRADIKCVINEKKLLSVERFRLLYSYVVGVLNFADWMASAKFSNSYPVVEFSRQPDKDFLIERLKEALKLDKFILKEFQEKLSITKGNVLVEIPTGEGKTEGSYLWAINNLKSKRSKIIYTLPTQTTSNKLFKRAESVFGDKTGLVHGSAKIYLEDLYLNENGAIDEHFKSDLLFSKTFNKPVTISTIDGVLKYFLNIGRFNIAMINILNSQIIIDEVHSYDFKLLGFIKRFLILSGAYSIPICIMSASIPEKIKELLNIKSYQYITDEKLFEKKANKIVKIKDSIDQNIEKICSEFNKGKNILVVRNKVDKSKLTYKELKNRGIENVILYNSQFKKKDRISKEDEIYKKLEDKEHFILVATQVVEISLDIDFEVMFTDICPIDALIQRLGRVNRRKREDKTGTVYVYSETDIKPYEKDMLDLTFETIEEGVHAIKVYNSWLNKVYDSIFESTRMIRELESKFREGFEEFDRNLERLQGISESDEKYNLRSIEFPKKDFILIDDYNAEDVEYENTVSLGAWLSDKPDYLFSKIDVHRKIFYDVLNLGYSYEYGVIFPDEEDSEKFDSAGGLFL